MTRRKKRSMHATEILQLLVQNRSKIRSYGVKRIGLFGSHIRGDATPSSDLDFLIELRKKSFDSYMGLKFYLEDLFNSEVDLVLSEAIKPRLRLKILKEVMYAPGL